MQACASGKRLVWRRRRERGSGHGKEDPFMKFTTIAYQLEETGIAWITLRRPKEMNAMSIPMFEELNHLLPQVDADPKVRAVILTGEGKAFCAGGDLSEMKAGYDGNAGFYHHMESANRASATLIELSKPVIAAVNGAATGAGINLALAADVAIASERAKFSEIFGSVGLIPDLGGTYLLPRLVGRAKAKEIVFTYRMIDAQEALELGLVNQVLPPEELLDAARILAEKFAQGPSFAFSMAKKLINRCYETDLHTALHMEALSQALSANSHDHEEGVTAFFEKRPPHFKGK